MDANQTRFHLVLGADNWGRALLADGATRLAAVWDADHDGVSLPGPKAARELRPWLDRESQEVSLWPELAVVMPSAGDHRVEISARRGAARDRYGNWYVVSPERDQILIRSSGSDAVSVFWPAAAAVAAPLTPGAFQDDPNNQPPTRGRCLFPGLVVTRDHHLVAISTVGVTEILVFDLFAGGPPLRLTWPEKVPLDVRDLAPREPGGFWLLDRIGPRLWEFNTYFQVVRPPDYRPATPPAEDFAPDAAAAASTTTEPRGTEAGSRSCVVAEITPAHALTLAETFNPIAVEPLPGGGALVLDRLVSDDPPAAAAGGADSLRFGQLAAYRGFRCCGQASLGEILRVIDTDELNVDPRRPWPGLIPHDFAVVVRPMDAPSAASEVLTARLHVADHLGNQSFSFILHVARDGAIALEPRAEFYPLRLFGGRALVAADGRAHYDSRDRFVPLIEQERPRYSEQAIIITAPLDSEIPACVWHRVLLETCVPGGTRILFASRATNADGADLASEGGPEAVQAAFSRLPWEEEPEPVVRLSGPELPWLRQEARSTRETRELLLQRPRGRYLQLRITLTGDGRRSPRVRALRVYYPRFSYAQRYLPACYRDDVVSASFLERFLANFEGTVTALEDQALALGAICDPRATPAELLDWLGRWYAVYLDPAWPPARKRLFLRHATTFFQWRGTARGLRAALRLAFDDCLDDDIFSEAGDRSAHARRYRIAEEFRRRLLVLEHRTAPERCPGVIPAEEAGASWWQPADGAAALHARWREYTGETGDYVITAPEDAGAATAWRQFSTTTLGFVPDRTAGDLDTWRRFLRCRYPSFAAGLLAWRDVWEQQWNREFPWDSFYDVDWPDVLPESAPALDDWTTFHRILQPMRVAAHRFTVSLPVQPQRARDSALLRVQLHLADRLVALEKPSHTAYRMQLYWALFRIDAARLGEDTQLGQGSRLPELLPPFVLGEGALAEGRLAPRPEDWARDRLVLGRNEARRIARPRRGACPPATALSNSSPL